VGRWDSSLTRVQPFFNQLLDRDPTGHDWLGPMLRALPRADVIPEELLDDPGTIDPKLVNTSSRGRRACFEYAAPPSLSFLRWSITNPDQLQWPNGSAGKFGADTTEWRRRLMKGTPEERDEAAEEGLSELDARGVEGARRKPWAFEGWTSVDCCLETDRLILFVEGKRKEKLSASTAWFPERNQLVRNLEVIGDLRPEKPGFVLLATEDRSEAPDRQDLPASAPHLNSEQLNALWNRYLGQITWRDLCDRVGLAFDSLPSEVP
jgi:hypothetical protein